MFYFNDSLTKLLFANTVKRSRFSRCLEFGKYSEEVVGKLEVTAQRAVFMAAMR